MVHLPILFTTYHLLPLHVSQWVNENHAQQVSHMSGKSNDIDCDWPHRTSLEFHTESHRGLSPAVNRANGLVPRQKGEAVSSFMASHP